MRENENYRFLYKLSHSTKKTVYLLTDLQIGKLTKTADEREARYLNRV